MDTQVEQFVPAEPMQPQAPPTNSTKEEKGWGKEVFFALVIVVLLAIGIVTYALSKANQQRNATEKNSENADQITPAEPTKDTNIYGPDDTTTSIGAQMTNLSYMDIVVNPKVEILVTDSKGRRAGKIVLNGETKEYSEIPNASYIFEPPVGNINNNGDITALGTGVNIFLLPQPTDGIYSIILSSSERTDYEVNVGMIDTVGNDQHENNRGTIGLNDNDEFEIDFSQQGSSRITKL